jgi:hypothetical protein
LVAHSPDACAASSGHPVSPPPNFSTSTASQDDREIALPFIFATFKLFENAWFQQRQGTLDRQQWKGSDVYIRIYFHRPGVKTWWSMRKMAFAPGFRSYLEATGPVSGVMSIGEMIRTK